MVTAKECNNMLAGEMDFHVCKAIAYKQRTIPRRELALRSLFRSLGLVSTLMIFHPLIDVGVGGTWSLGSMIKGIVLQFLLVVEKSPDAQDSLSLKGAELPDPLLS